MLPYSSTPLGGILSSNRTVISMQQVKDQFMKIADNDLLFSWKSLGVFFCQLGGANSFISFILGVIEMKNVW